MIDKKKGQGNLTSQWLILLLVALLIFVVIISGIVPKTILLIKTMIYKVDTNDVEACYALYDQKLGDLYYKELLSDYDKDELFDYACDTCICRDGYQGRLCNMISHGIGKDTDIELGMRDLFNMDRGSDELKVPKCTRNDGEYLDCSTDNLDVFDEDNDLIPNICDKRPRKFEGEPKCYRGTIYNADGDAIGYMHEEEITGLDKFHCIFVLCTDKALLYDDAALHKARCGGAFGIVENDLVTINGADYDALVRLYNG